MAGIFSLKGSIQNYEWGGKEFIPKLLGQKPSQQKCAEYWMGAHANVPSSLVTSNGKKPLNEFLNSNLNEYLGKEVSAKFGRLPFLFKVLDVHEMLSIQVHPTKSEAEKGFIKENELGIALNAPNRNYKDNNHKPEIMVALSEFWLLHGFLIEEKLSDVLVNTPELNHLKDVFEEKGYKGLYKLVMEESSVRTNEVLKPLIDRILPSYHSGELDKSTPDYWAAKAYQTFCNKGDLDKGIYSIYFFNIVKAMPGEAVFQDAGIPHAYLQGQNMELMANSDNVLRGGLTPKHVDVSELLKHVNFEETIPDIMKGELAPDGLERKFKCPTPDFELSKISLSNPDQYLSKVETGQILLLVEGEVMISEGSKELKLRKGDAIFISAGSNYKMNSPSKVVIYKASTPTE